MAHVQLKDYRNAIMTQSGNIDGVYIVCDRTNKDTLIGINRWMKCIKFVSDGNIIIEIGLDFALQIVVLQNYIFNHQLI